jgi:predicted nucleic acid-binding protein
VTVIDTSLFIAAQRGRDSAKQKLDELLERPEDLAISAMTILEVYAAPRMSPAWARFYAEVFEDLEVLDLDAEAAEDGARLARDMARRGFKLHNADAAIAGCAARAGASAIVTTDGDFTELRGVRIEYVQPS